jgi:hypothetical protein
MAKTTVKQGKATISTKHSDGTHTESEEIVTEEKFTKPTANVGVSAGFTRNTGNYCSVRVQISLNLPCYIEEIDAVCDFAQEWVDRRLDSVEDSVEVGE